MTTKRNEVKGGYEAMRVNDAIKAKNAGAGSPDVQVVISIAVTVDKEERLKSDESKMSKLRWY